MTRPQPIPTPLPYTTLFRSLYVYRAPEEISRRLDQGGSGYSRSPRRAFGAGSAGYWHVPAERREESGQDRKSTRLNSSHSQISYAVFCLKKKTAFKHHDVHS